MGYSLWDLQESDRTVTQANLGDWRWSLWVVGVHNKLLQLLRPEVI